MRYYLDTEFIDRPPIIDMISIGIVAEDGRTYYAESSECDRGFACSWVKQNVFPHLLGRRRPRGKIAREIVEFVGNDTPEWWGWFPAYDFVVLTQLYGKLVGSTPLHWPNRPNDLVQLATFLGVNRNVLPVEPKNAHNALADARWCRDVHRFLETLQVRA